MWIVRPLLFLAILLMTSLPVAADQVEVVAGAGPSTAIVKLFFDTFPRQPETAGYRFLVPELSAKHRGGILNADNFLFGRTGRPLAAYERRLGKREIILGRIPVAIVVGSGVERVRLSLADLKKIYQREICNWQEVGGPDAAIELVGRERREVVFTLLKERYPFFKKVSFDRVFLRDNDVMNHLASKPGRYAIAFGAASNFSPASHIDIAGFDAGIEVGLVYDSINARHPVVVAAHDYAASGRWQLLLEQSGVAGRQAAH